MSSTTLTAEQIATYTTRLTQAEMALHDLTIGGHARVIVDQNGERVEFTAPSAGRLRAYIAELKSILGQGGVCGPMGAFML